MGSKILFSAAKCQVLFPQLEENYFMKISGVLCPWITDICTMLLQTTGVDKGWILEFSCMGGQSCLTFCNPMNYSQDPLSLGFPRQKYCSGFPHRPPEDLPDPGMEPKFSCVSCIGSRVFHLSPLGSSF